ncbi:MAG: mannose-1-phosphate guanylyltransferase [Candidatus Cryptobacteroides sp.]|nr:mannose-1-phosphate guanylyltransferase [Candidatus Cryptobacteroides sp.]MDY5569852.1 mannose-1-phosphate guanylyltransferase [Candidatus Cryptobacteroides sp.]
MKGCEHTNIVIMAGGIGSRLWPVSTPEMPKQFIDLLGVGKSLLQLTVERFRSVAGIAGMWVVTSENYVDIVRKQLPEMPADHILAEPVPRNTAPCIAYACWRIMREDPEANIVVTPSDAIVLKTELFSEIISKALEFTASTSSIVTVGIHPDRPETGYGYICSSSKEECNVVKVNEFREKPDRETAERYLAAGNYFWNAGIFVWSVSTIVDQMRRHAPQIAGMMDKIAGTFGTEEEKAALAEFFPQCDKISIDYAVMEKSDSIYVISADLGWSDLGSWTSAGSHIAEGPDGNRVVGNDVRLIDSEGCIVHAEECKKVVVKGLKDYVVACRGGNLLVCPAADEQKIKDYAADAPSR